LAAATSASAIRGYSINLLFIDEAAFIDNWDEFFTSVFPTISSGKSTKIVLVSTPNGMNHFYKLWDGAATGENNYNPIQVMWHNVPGRDEAWRKDTLAAMGGDTEKFNQEHCCEFLGSSGTLISGWKLKELVVAKPEHADLGLSLYNHPEQDRLYTIICDVSRGKGLDYSAFQVIDVTQMPYRQVCTYRNNLITPTDFAEIAQVELLSINAKTEATEFRKEIRWNSLHYKLSK
jgi:phage FluMu gp28-like protein